MNVIGESTLWKNSQKAQKEMNDSTKIEIAKAALKEIGNLTVEGCEDNNSEIARKYQELNKLAKVTYELLNEWKYV